MFCLFDACEGYQGSLRRKEYLQVFCRSLRRQPYGKALRQGHRLIQRLAGEDADRGIRVRRNLLKYCGLDTFAMVKVWEKLREVAK